MEKLIFKTFFVTKGEAENSSGMWTEGEIYGFFQDPSTGKFYRPNDGFITTGANLDKLFTEIEAIEQ
jgi:hypothetical protein